jgi:hypothetical protein
LCKDLCDKKNKNIKPSSKAVENKLARLARLSIISMIQIASTQIVIWKIVSTMILAIPRSSKKLKIGFTRSWVGVHHAERRRSARSTGMFNMLSQT